MTKPQRPAPIRFEHGTVVYRPGSTPSFRIVGRDADGTRVYATATDEESARRKARDLEARRIAGLALRPDNSSASERTVARLAALYLVDLEKRGCSLRYRAASSPTPASSTG